MFFCLFCHLGLYLLYFIYTIKLILNELLIAVSAYEQLSKFLAVAHTLTISELTSVAEVALTCS